MIDSKISVIIPTLNEASYLRKTVRHLLAAAKDRSAIEVLVIDAGSSDGTLETVGDFPIRVFRKPEFVLKKYASLNFGIQKADGEVLIFLDADTLLPHHFDVLIEKSLKKGKMVGGAFEFAFHPVDFRLRLIEWINRFRYRLDGIYFGDQAIFCRKVIAKKVGGFPEDELMDAAFFCKRLRKEGRLKLVNKTVTTSSRRFSENGYFRMFWFDFLMWMRFHFLKRTSSQRASYWEFNLDR